MDLIVYAVQSGTVKEKDLAWVLLKFALAEELGLRELPETARHPGGKPFFPGHPDIEFNISHSRGGAACALHTLPVGVDLEKLRPAPRRLAGDLDDEPFFRLWTAKEATAKRDGKGIAVLRTLEPSGLCRCLEGLLPGYIVTVCPTEEDSVIRTRRVEMEELTRP